MVKKILINAIFPEEIRSAIVENGELTDFDLESGEHFRTKSNIYKGIITRVEPGLEAVFVNYGETRNGFLPIREIIPQYFSPGEKSQGIKDMIQVGQEVVVQVDKEARKDKGAALTTRLSITGAFVILIRGITPSFNISRRLAPDDRKKIQDWLPRLQIPEGFGAIIRTAAAERDFKDLEWDLKYTNEVWNSMQKTVQDHRAPQLLLKESDVVSRTLRDYLNDDVEEIIVDTQDAYQHTEILLSKLFPTAKSKLKLYDENIPLFTRYGIENRVQSAFQHVINLPSGGELVFDRTEAMFIIDVNSSKSNTGKDVEDTALKTNLEAVSEISRQMKWRDIGGLMVIDFIDMMRMDNRKKVEDVFQDAVRTDNARVRFNKISRFGMMELSRQRLRSSLDEFYLEKCPTCHGKGTVATQNSTVLKILRILEELANNSNITEIKLNITKEIHAIIAEFPNDRFENIKNKLANKIEIMEDDKVDYPGYKIIAKDHLGNENIFGEDQSKESVFHHKEKTRRDPLIETDKILNKLPGRKSSVWERFKKFVGGFGKLFTRQKARSHSGRNKRHYSRRRRFDNNNRYRQRHRNSRRYSNSRNRQHKTI